MNCDKVKELLWAYLENKTTAEETAEIETHLEGCAACREELAQQKEIKNALASLPDEELPEGYHTELMQKLQAERKIVPFPAKKKHGWKQMSMIAAAVLVVVVAVFSMIFIVFGGGVIKLYQSMCTSQAVLQLQQRPFMDSR